MRIPGPAPALGVSLAVLLTACAAGPEPDTQSGPRSTPTRSPDQARAELIPAGFGTLHQDAVTVPLRWGQLLIKTTPLAESVIRLTAPDTYQRLSGLATAHRPALEQRAFTSDFSMFLVSVFSYDANIPFTPEDLLFSSQGLRFRQLAVQPVTPGWERRRLNQQETQMAIYAVEPGIDLEVDFVVQYQAAESNVWDAIIQVMQGERSKVLARAGSPDTTGAPQR